MTVGEWEPNRPTQVSMEQLAVLIGLLQSVELDDLPNTLDKEAQKAFSYLMKQTKEAWPPLDTLSDEELNSLIRFFTVAEMQLPGWDAGKTSPVIYLVKALKERDAFSAELRKWIKATSDNRFLPNGAILFG